MKRMQITMGNGTEDMIRFLTGTVSDDWEFPDYFCINMISEDDVETRKLYQLSVIGSAMLQDPNYIKKIVTKILLQLGVPANIRGFYYLREAIDMTLFDTGVVDSITKRLYPVLAERYKTTAYGVERSMRYAIETAWLRGKTEVVDELFGYTIQDSKGKPTNSEFVATIADQIRLYHMTESMGVIHEEGDSK